ncbi:Vacuolar protein sorting-associated protein 45 [[Candida] zeylanoides]
MSMDLIKTSDAYYSRLFGSASTTPAAAAPAAALPGSRARVLLLDEATVPVVSMCYTQSQLLASDVILIESIENQAHLNPMRHLNCICYLSPSPQSISHMARELQNPHYAHYQIYFNNTATKAQLEELAAADEREAVTSVVEVFQDYLVVNDNLFLSSVAGGRARQRGVLDESASLVSLLLSLRKCPIIQYESNSKELRKLSSELLYSINSNSNNNLFDEVNAKLDAPPVLLLLDRKNDPVTPLLLPWTYQSMIHELIGISRNVVTLDAADDAEKLTLSSATDAFFKSSMYLNYGDLTEKVQKYVEEYKNQTKQSSATNLQTKNLSDLKDFLAKFPEFRKFSVNVSKHLNLVSELDRQINRQGLWDLGELQQTISADLEGHAAVKQRIHKVLRPPSHPQQSAPAISTANKVKLVLLYALHYESVGKPDNETDVFISMLADPSVTTPPPTVSQLAVLRSFKKYIGASKRAGGSGGVAGLASLGAGGASGGAHGGSAGGSGSSAGSSRTSMDGLGSGLKKFNQLFIKPTAGTPQPDNVYMQHVPRLSDTLRALVQQHGGQATPQHGAPASVNLATLVPEAVARQYGDTATREPLQDVIIYVRGGVTYEEARLVHEWNNTNRTKLNIVIGGSQILNSDTWMEALCDMVIDAETNAQQEMPSRATQLRDIL